MILVWKHSYILNDFFNDSGSQVNSNGILSFRSEYLQYSPQLFPFAGLPLIAPFWDDVDITRFGNIFYRVTNNTTLLQRARDQLQELFPSSGNFTPTTLFIATWDRVAQFGGGYQVSAYMTIFLLVTKTSFTHLTVTDCLDTYRLGGLIRIVGHYTNSAVLLCSMMALGHSW